MLPAVALGQEAARDVRHDVPVIERREDHRLRRLVPVVPVLRANGGVLVVDLLLVGTDGLAGGG